jgi:hypothetical protein
MSARMAAQEEHADRRSSPGVRASGICLVTAGLLWQPLLGWEHLDHLDQRGSAGWTLDQQGFLLAMMLLLIGLAALDHLRVAGDGLVGRWALHGLVVGWLLLVVGQCAGLWFSWSAATTLIGVGGLLTYPTALVAGASVVRAGRLSAWRRWALLVQGAYQTTLILVPLMLGGAGPGWPSEAGWQAGWVVVGVAALQEPRRAATHRSAQVALR